MRRPVIKVLPVSLPTNDCGRAFRRRRGAIIIRHVVPSVSL